MTTTKGLITEAATTALDTRKADAVTVATSAAGAPRVGVLTDNPSIVTSDASTAPMRVAVAAAGLVTQRSAADGVAIWTNDGSIFVTITKPGSNSHYVVVYAKHNDSVAGDPNSLSTIAVVTGAAAASPSVPAVPSGALELARILVPSTATSSQSAGVVITNTYPMTAMRGGVVPVRNATELAAWIAADGNPAYQIDTDVLYGRVAGAWVAISDVDTGWTVCTPESAFYNITTYGDDRALSVRRIGKLVRIEGHISTDGATASYSVWAYIPVGFRPAKNVWIKARQDGTGSTMHGAFITAAGNLTFATAASGAQSFMVSDTYFID